MSLDHEFIASLVRGDHIRQSIKDNNPFISDEEVEKAVAEVKAISARYPIIDKQDLSWDDQMELLGESVEQYPIGRP